jgi:4-carboxymuconolactone decarboxylase
VTETEDRGLTSRQQATAAIAAFTAAGQLPPLREALTDGLRAGLTISEINEILVQMYAYAGFLRSLNGIGTFMALLDERRATGASDPAGRQPTELPPARTSSSSAPRTRPGSSVRR